MIYLSRAGSSACRPRAQTRARVFEGYHLSYKSALREIFLQIDSGEDTNLKDPAAKVGAISDDKIDNIHPQSRTMGGRR